MKVAVTGASGLIGGALVPFLRTGGHDVRRLVRRAPREESEIPWDPARGEIDGCTACHTNHGTEGTSPDAIQATCVRCHAEGSASTKSAIRSCMASSGSAPTPA